jgi:hypothetical protein
MHRRGHQALQREAVLLEATASSAHVTHETAAYAKSAIPVDPIATAVDPAAPTDSPAMASSARVGFPTATGAASTPTAAACGGPVAAWRSSVGFLGRSEHPGGESEQCKTRVAQEAAAPEPNLRELLVVDCCLEFGHLGFVQRHTLLPPFDRFLVCDLYQASLPRQIASGFHELDQG